MSEQEKNRPVDEQPAAANEPSVEMNGPLPAPENAAEEQESLRTRLVAAGVKRLDSFSQRWGVKQSTPTILLFAIALFIISIVVWASVAELDHVVRGMGKVITPKQTQLVQSLEGGIIEQIHVREGAFVKAGDLLVSLDPTQAKSLFGQASKEERSLLIRVERLRAEKENREPVFAFEQLRDEADIVAAEKAQLAERRNVLKTERNLLEAQISQREAECRQAEAELVRAEKEYQLANAEYDVIADLVERQLESRLSLINVDREKNEAIARLNTAKVAVRRSEAVLAESRFRKSQAQLNYANEVGNEYATVIARLAEVQQKLQGVQDRLNRTKLVAPVNATVNKIHIRTEGGVVQPGAPILELTPTDGKIEIDAQIMQKDIAFVHLGQMTHVKLTAYDFSRFGGVEGKVTFVSPDAQKDEQGREFFQVRIELDSAYVGKEDEQYPITPGMVANVSMMITKRTVIEYLLEPVFKLRDRAFRE